MVVTHDRQDAAMLGRANQIGMPQRVHGAIEARPLAVPHAVDAIELGIRLYARLLATPDGADGQVFVDRGLELDVMLGEKFARAP